jgi:hypothetical protein
MKRATQTFALIAALALSGAAINAIAQTGPQTQKQIPTQNQGRQRTIRDQNGDGLCDITGQRIGSGQRNAYGRKARGGKRWGPGDGTGNQGVGPQNGTGYGSPSGRMTGPQNGTGAGMGARGYGRGGQRS